MGATRVQAFTLPPSLLCHQHLDKAGPAAPRTQRARMWSGARGSREEAQRAVW